MQQIKSKAKQNDTAKRVLTIKFNHQMKVTQVLIKNQKSDHRIIIIKNHIKSDLIEENQSHDKTLINLRKIFIHKKVIEKTLFPKGQHNLSLNSLKLKEVNLGAKEQTTMLITIILKRNGYLNLQKKDFYIFIQKGQKLTNGIFQDIMTLNLKKQDHILLMIGQRNMIREARNIGKIWKLSIFNLQNQIVRHIQFKHLFLEIWHLSSFLLSLEVIQVLLINREEMVRIIKLLILLALHHSVSNGHKEITALLCELGAMFDLIDSEDLSGCTPLFLAMRYNETECLKILISYNCDIDHRLKNGDNCMHIAAAYNSLDAMVIVSNFGGFELFLGKNRLGKRPIDIAEKMKNFECFEALQKMERNLQFQNAILEREIQSIDKATKKKRSNKIQPAKSQRLVSKPTDLMMKQKKRLNIINEKSSEEYNSEEDQGNGEELENLGGRMQYKKRVMEFQNELKAQQHERRYIDKLEFEKKNKKKRKVSNIQPFYDYMNEKEQKKQVKKRQQRIQEENSDSSQQQNTKRRQQSKSHRAPNNNQIHPFNEQNDDSYIEQRDYDNQVKDLQQIQQNISQRNGSFIKLSIRDDTTFIKNPKLRQLHTARNMYLINNNINEDEEEEEDEENQIQIASNSLRTNRSLRRQQEEQKASLMEKAYEQTSSLVKQLGGMFKSGFNTIRGYVFQQEEHNQRRSRSRRQRDNSSSSSEVYKTPRGASKSQKRSQSRKNKNKIMPFKEDMVQSSDYIPQRKQQIKTKSNQIYPQKRYNEEQILEQLRVEDMQQQQQVQNENSGNKSGNSTKKSIQIQVETNIENNKKLIKPKVSQNSLKSVGLLQTKYSMARAGSINVNESINAQSQYSSQKSQKKEHSRMIQMEKKKRLGNKSKQLIHKNYQSSEDERAKVNQQLIERSPSPAPRYMKEEIEYYKYQQRETEMLSLAFEKKQLQQNEQQPTQESEQILPINFSSQKRQILKQSNNNIGIHVQNNQRYLPRNSTSPSGPENQIIQQKDQQQTQKRRESAQNLRAPTLLTQEQFDMIMLNSEEETKKQFKNTNNQYLVIDSDKNSEKQTPKAQPNGNKNEDIQKFYEDLMQNNSVTNLNIDKNATQSIDVTNLSNLYQIIMHKQNPQGNGLKNTLAQRQDELIEQLKQQTPQKKQEDSLFDPSENDPDLENNNYNTLDNQSITLIKSVINEMEDYHNISDCSFINPIMQNTRQQQSNFLDKGQFIQNSCISICQQQNISQIQRPLFGKQNNSLHFNVQYQSDAEVDNKPKKPLFLKILKNSNADVSPLRKPQQLIPPLSQKHLQMTPLQDSDNSSSARVVLTEEYKSQYDNDTHRQQNQQQHMIDLFKEDVEQERMQEPINSLSPVKIKQSSLADELKHATFNDIEDGGTPQYQEYQEMEILKPRNSDEINDNMVILESFVSDNTLQIIPKLKQSIQEKLIEIEQVQQNNISDFESPRIKDNVSLQRSNQILQRNSNAVILDDNSKSNKQTKKNTRYGECDDSYINFDITTSKIDKTQQQIDNVSFEQQKEAKILQEPEKQQQSLTVQIQQQIQSYVENPKKQVQMVEIEAEVLPLKVLRPAYKQEEVQTWEEESGCLIDTTQLHKALLGNVVAQAFSASSNPKKIQRQYIPYQGQAASTAILLHELATGSENVVEETPKTNTQEQIIRKSQQLRKSQTQFSQVSQDSILQDLDSISRIYNDLETVQEEEIGITNPTVEESKIADLTLNNKKKIIPKEEYDMKFEDKDNQQEEPIMKQIFYHKEGLQNKKQSENPNRYSQSKEEQEEMTSQIAPNYWQWRREEKQNRSTATAFIYNIQTSSDEETKKKSIYAHARPKKQKIMHSSINGAPLYGQQMAKQKTIKDVSFKSTNMSTHTEGSERLKENLKLFQKNKMNLRKNSKEKNNNDGNSNNK